MDSVMILLLLACFSTLTGLIVEAIKKVSKIEKGNYELVSLIIALVVGSLGTALYYIYNNIPFTAVNDVTIGLMGFASGLISQVGYDKVKDLINKFIGGK